MDSQKSPHLVITGSTRGIGYGLAIAFLDLGCSVTICGRAQPNVDGAVQDLAARYDRERVAGYACDVRRFEQVEALWQAASARARVDIWINNAGASGPVSPVPGIPPEEAAAVIETNLLGAIYGSQVALRGMLAHGGGAIYNMEGMGSDGRKHDGLTLYGTSKYGLKYFNDCLAKETEATPVIVGALRPGMVATDLLVRNYEGRPQEWARAKKAFNLLAERVEIVAPWLAHQILNNRTNGARLRYLTSGRMLKRMLKAPFSKRDLFDQ